MWHNCMIWLCFCTIQRKEEFIRQTLEEKRARGEIAGEFYAGTWLQFSSLFPCRPYQAFHGESLHGNEPVFMKWFYSLPTEDVKTLTANELSVFYKQFLDEKFQDHMNYSKLVTAHCYDLPINFSIMLISGLGVFNWFSIEICRVNYMHGSNHIGFSIWQWNRGHLLLHESSGCPKWG